MATTKIEMPFKKGDVNIHYFQIPAANWAAGGTLQFTAKPAVDNDATDAAAVIDKDFDDTDIVGSGHEEYVAGYVTYELRFEPGDITGVNYLNGEKKKTYNGEFQFITVDGDPVSYPGDSEFIVVPIHGDIKRGVA